METVLAAAISGAVSLLVCILTNRAQAEKTRVLLDYRLCELEKKVNKHNNLVERTYRLEGDVEVIHEQIRVANHRIGDLEKK